MRWDIWVWGIWKVEEGKGGGAAGGGDGIVGCCGCGVRGKMYIHIARYQQRSL